MDQRSIKHLRHALGEQVLDLVEDRTVTDIYLNEPDELGGPGILWAVRQGQRASPVGIMTAVQATSLITAVAGTLGTLVNHDKPWVEGELFGDGARFDGMIPPIVPFPVFAIRVPSWRLIPLAEYVSTGAMTYAQALCLEDAIARRLHIIVCAATGDGKTTLLNALADAVHRLTPHDRMAVVEGLRELRIPVRDKLRLRTGDALTEQEAIRRVLRQLPTRIWVGEVRGAEAHPMLMAWNTGHRGGACSLHSDIANPQEALRRVEQMVALATASPQQQVIGSTINLIVCLGRDDRNLRQVTGIWSVHGWDASTGRYTLKQEA